MGVTNASLAVVSNPVGAEEQTEALSAELKRRGLSVQWFETTEDDPGTGQTESAIAAGADTVVVCGGDGTVRACVESLAGSAASLAIVPAGTGNLLARNLGIPDAPAEALDVAVNGRRCTIDVGYANGEAFAVMAGAGLDAAIMRDTSRSAKDTLGSLAYVATAFRHLRDDRVGAVLIVDGAPAFHGPVATVLAANYGQLQGGVDLFPDSEPNDGTLDYLAISAAGVGDWLGAALAVLMQKEPKSLISRWRGSRAEFSFSAPTPYQLDGDERPATTRLVIECRPAALAVMVPEAAS